MPALSTLGSQFGLGAMIDRPLACIPDAHLSAAADRAIILDRLLSISGEDAVTVERKYMPAWEGKLPTRILMGANEPPRLSDASGALVSRLIILRQTETFLNREDRTLDAQLASELPSILNWALEGLARLRARGRFVAPASSRELTAEVGEMAAPVSTFVADWCATDPQHEVRISMLYYSWRAWCGEHGHDHPGTVQMFSHALRAAYPTLGRTRRRVEGRVEKFFAGIRLLTAEEGGPIDVKSAGKK